MSPFLLRRGRLRLLTIGFVSIGSIVSISFAARRQNAAGSLAFSAPKRADRPPQLPSKVSMNQAGSTVGQQGPLASGALSFSQPSYNVNEGGTATITLTRTGGVDNQVVAKVGITDVTTSPSDYTRLVPGKIDTTFTPTTKPGNFVRDLVIQPDGKILVAGFQTPDGTDSGDGLVRLNPNGTNDTSFSPGVIVADGQAVALQPDGKIVVVGVVRITAPPGSAEGIARLNANGSLDSSFTVGSGFSQFAVNAIAVQPDGKIIVGGNFPKYNGFSRPNLIRLNTDGTPDSSFAVGAGPSSEVLAVKLQPDGKIIIGGRFGLYDGVTRKNLARLNADGSLDLSFIPSSVTDDLNFGDMALQPDGKLLVGGIFFVNSPSDSTTITPLFRLNSDGTQDQSFFSTLGHKNWTNAIVIQPDGKIIVGGAIVRTPQDPLYFLNRLNTDGTPDTTFSSGIVAFSNSSLDSLALQGDGKPIAGGQFTGATPSIPWKFLHRLEGDMFVTWPAGDASDKTITLPAVDDALLEPTESLTLSLTPVQGGATTGTNPTATLSIIDNDTQITNVSGTGVFGGTATMTATLSSFSGPLNGKTVSFKFNNTTVGSAVTDANGMATITNVSLSGINAGVYQGVIFPSFAGDSTFAASNSAGTLTVNKAPATLTLSSSVNPSDFGQSITFTATASSGAGTPGGSVVFKADGTTFQSGGTINGSGQAFGTIATLTSGTHSITAELNSNNFTASPAGPLSQMVKVAPTVSINDAVGVEGNSGTRTVFFVVTLTPSSNATVSVSFATANATATSGSDYQSATGSVTFNPGVSSRTISVNIIGDTNVEPDETFSVNLLSAQNATIARNQGTGMIVSDDNGSGNPIDLPGFFVRQHYADFLSREPDLSGFEFWRNQITSCGSDPTCTEVKRINASAAFFLSIEFQQTGYLVERMYKSAYGDATGTSSLGGSHQLPVPIVRSNEFLKDTQRIGQGVVVLAPGWEQALENNKQAYSGEFVATTRFATAFPTTMTPAEFVDRLNQNAGIVLSAGERITAINLFIGASDTSNASARAQAVRMVADDQDLYNAEFNRAFVLTEYIGYLRRNPNDAPESTLDYSGYDFWLNKLNENHGDYIAAEMVKAFISSSEYRQRFGP